MLYISLATAVERWCLSLWNVGVDVDRSLVFGRPAFFGDRDLI